MRQSRMNPMKIGLMKSMKLRKSHLICAMIMPIMKKKLVAPEESASEEESGNRNRKKHFEYDELDMEYEEMLEKRANINTEESDMFYCHKLTAEEKKDLFKQTNDIYDYSSSAISFTFQSDPIRYGYQNKINCNG